jgi:hypothetical protein
MRRKWQRFVHRFQLRWPYLLMYLCLTFTGIIVAIAPSPTAQQQLRFFLPVWFVFFIVGGSSSALGIVLGRWSGEAVGLPLLSSALLIYAMILVIRVQGGGVTAPLIAFSLLLAGFGFGLLGRWFDVLKLLQAARELDHHGR